MEYPLAWGDNFKISFGRGDESEMMLSRWMKVLRILFFLGRMTIGAGIKVFIGTSWFPVNRMGQYTGGKYEVGGTF